MSATEGTRPGPAEIERWWPHLSIEAKHRLLAELGGPIDADTAAEVQSLTGGEAPASLSPAEQQFVLTQMEAVD